jgi:nucleoid-associated protein YgaU
MGREAKLLLGLLATLLGVFVGVLSMKLLVPRPPVGAGPDIHTEVAAGESQDLVEPPQFPTDSPALPPADAVEPVAAETPRDHIAASPPRDSDTRDPFVARASFQSTAAPAAVPSPPAAATPAPMPGTAYVTRPGDSWWSLAEMVYGDGRLYRAVFAWNRAIDARVSLVPGTAIELPFRDRLEAAWPALIPTR